MLHRLTGAARVEPGLLQREVPFGGAVGVVDEHEVGVVLQANCLALHGLLVLAYKFLAKEAANGQHQWSRPAKNIPRGTHVDAAMVLGDGRDRGQSREPSFAAAHCFKTQVGQDEINGGLDLVASFGARESHEFVRRAVGRGRVRAHAEAVRDGLEVLFFFVNAVAAAPPP